MFCGIGLGEANMGPVDTAAGGGVMTLRICAKC